LCTQWYLQANVSSQHIYKVRSFVQHNNGSLIITAHIILILLSRAPRIITPHLSAFPACCRWPVGAFSRGSAYSLRTVGHTTYVVWSLRLQNYRFTICHLKGKHMPADFISRTVTKLHSEP